MDVLKVVMNKKKPNKSVPTAFYLFTKFRQGNVRGVAKQCFDLLNRN